MTCRKLSGSSRSPSAVDPVTSQNSTVTVLRRTRGAGAGPKAAPHPLQKPGIRRVLPPAGRACPHTSKARSEPFDRASERPWRAAHTATAPNNRPRVPRVAAPPAGGRREDPSTSSKPGTRNPGMHQVTRLNTPWADARLAAPMWATGVKRAWRFNPVTCVVSPGWPDCSSGSSSQLPGHVAVREESSWSARSRAAARTNELDADERRTIMDSEEGSFRAGL